mgnify:CR=1 FL=1
MSLQDSGEYGVTPSKELNQTLNTVRRSDRIKANDQNRSKYSGDPSHRELSILINPPRISKSTSVEQLVNHFNNSDVSKGAIPKRKDNFNDSVADQIRDCSIGNLTSLRSKHVSFEPGHNPMSGQNRESPRENLEFELEGATALPSDVSAALQKALRLSQESHQAVTELGKTVKEDMKTFMHEIMRVIEPLKSSLVDQNSHPSNHHDPVEIQSVQQIQQSFVQQQYAGYQMTNQVVGIDNGINTGARYSSTSVQVLASPGQNIHGQNYLEPNLYIQKTSNVGGQKSDSSRSHHGNAVPPHQPLPTENIPATPGYQHQSSPGPRRRYSYGNNGSLQVSKWGLRFDGSRVGLHIDDFLFRIEHLQNMYNCSWNDVLSDFHLLVEGDAKAWYWVFLSTNSKAGNPDIDWPILRRALAKRFKSSKTSYDVLQELLRRRQGATEPVDKYFLEMMTLLGRLDVPLPEAESVKLIKDNLNDSLKRIVYPIQIYNLEHLRDQCWEAERTFGRREDRPFSHIPNRNVQSQVLQKVH